jgi:hypothetical protein
MGISTEKSERTNDFISHEGFDRVFERRLQMEYPDYFM